MRRIDIGLVDDIYAATVAFVVEPIWLRRVYPQGVVSLLLEIDYVAAKRLGGCGVIAYGFQFYLVSIA